MRAGVLWIDGSKTRWWWRLGVQVCNAYRLSGRRTPDPEHRMRITISLRVYVARTVAEMLTTTDRKYTIKYLSIRFGAQRHNVIVLQRHLHLLTQLHEAYDRDIYRFDVDSPVK